MNVSTCDTWTVLHRQIGLGGSVFACRCQATRGFAPCAAVLPIRPVLLAARSLLTERLGVATREDIGEVGAAGTGEVLAAPEMVQELCQGG